MNKANTPSFTTDDTKAAKQAVEAKQAAAGDLPPPGAARTEELTRRAEELLAEASKIQEQIDCEVAKDSVEVEREVRQALNDLNEVYVSNEQTGYAYSWVYSDPRNEFGGRWVRKLQALGYEVVQGEMPEAREHLHVDGTRHVADCILMRVKLDRKALLDRRDALLREAQQAGITSRIADLADRAGSRLYDKLPDFVEDSMQARTAQRRQAAQSQFHRMNATGKMDRMLRSGTIPGVPVPGAGR